MKIHCRGLLSKTALFLFVATVAFGVRAAWSQISTSASITGTVRDVSGAVVPGATVTVINQGTAVSLTTTTDSRGSFVMPDLSVGTYTVRVSKHGFQTYSVSGVILHPTEVTTVEATMKVGAITTHVNVIATATQVQTATAGITNEVSGKQVFTLPLNGRNYQSLSALIPGVTNLSPDRALNQGGFLTSNVMSINGMGQAGTMYYLDGIWNMNTGNMTQTTITPNPDTIQEVRTLQNNYSAQYSLMGSNVVVLQTKSGTDQFHGTAFEYLRNTGLNARNFFAPTVPAYHQNIFGGTIGGPLYIPGHKPKSSKTFFYGSEQWTLQSEASVVNGTTPTLAMRSGQFPLTGPFGGVITNPLTGAPFPSNTIPANMINKQSLLLMNTLQPLPNNVPAGFLNYINLTPAYNKTRDDEGKIDRIITPRLRLMAEYLDDRQINNNTYDTFLGSPYTTSTDPIKTDNQLAQIQLTQTLSPSMVNTTHVSMNNYVVYLALGGIVNQNQVPGYSQNLPFKGGFESNRLPQISFSEGYSPLGVSTSLPLNHASDLEDSLSDDWSWLRGNNYIQGGIQYVRGTKRQTLFAASNGSWLFSGSFTGNPIADYLLGDATNFYQQSTELRPYVHYPIVSPYIQDRWKATRRLTLSAGLRLEYLPEPHPQLGYESAFFPSHYNASQAPIVNPDGTITPTANFNPLNGIVIDGVNGIPQNFTYGNKWYLAPDVGFAWDVFGNGNTALRGGFGITYDRTPTGTDCSYQCASNPPAVNSITLESPNFPNPIGAAAAPLAAPTFGQNAYPFDQAGRVITYSLSLQHQFAGNWFASIAGAGNFAQHIGDFWNINQPLPDAPYQFNPLINSDPALPGAVGIFQNIYSPYLGYGGMSTMISNDYAHWNALEISVRHPVGHNLFFNVSYTWQHDLSNDLATTLFENSSSMQNVYAPGQNYGNSPLNVPQILTFSTIYNLPWYKNATGWRGQTIGGWTFSDMTTIQSGFSMSPGLSVAFPGLASRPNRSASNTVGPQTVGEWFNTAAFAQAPFGYFGGAAPGSIYGPGVADFDMALYKDFHVTEHDYFQFRAEAFNIFNRANFSGVSTGVGAGNYGQVTSALDPRIMEFALRFQF